MADQPGWECDTCRIKGLEKTRNCAWLPVHDPAHNKAVWARKDVVVTACPKSLITPASVEIVERYVAWKWSGEMDLLSLPAKLTDGILALEQESRKQVQNGQ